MFHGSRLSAGLLLLALAAGCQALSRMGSATVQNDSDGQPCIGIESTAATKLGHPRVQAINVYVSGGEAKEPILIWSFMKEPKAVGLSLKADQCIPYGKTPVNMLSLVEPAPLTTGVVYLVSVNARLNDPSDSTRSYQGEFCLIPDLPRAPRVHQILWDAKAGKWQRDVCFSSSPSKK